jgi:hypothetical protein
MVIFFAGLRAVAPPMQAARSSACFSRSLPGRAAKAALRQ